MVRILQPYCLKQVMIVEKAKTISTIFWLHHKGMKMIGKSLLFSDIEYPQYIFQKIKRNLNVLYCSGIKTEGLVHDEFMIFLAKQR